MRDAVNYCLPVVQNPLDGLGVANAGPITNIAGNGYYGYFQPAGPKEDLGDGGKCDHRMDTEPSNSRRQSKKFDSCAMEVESDWKRANRKRVWEDGGERAFKKRRENEPSDPPLPRHHPPRPAPALKQPTHNVPDMQRCIMGHYI